MSSPNILDGMSTIELKAMLKLSLSQLAANKTDSVEQSILDAKQKEVNEIATALSTASDAVETKASTSLVDYQTNQTRNWIHNDIQQISTFMNGGPDELSSFIDALKIVYDTHVMDNLKLESIFVKCAKGRLGKNIYSNLVNSKVTMNTFDDFTKWLRATYDSQLTQYQLLGAAWDAEFDPADVYITFAHNVEKKLRTATDTILEDYKKKNSGSEMSAKKFADLVGGMLMCEKLKQHNKLIYRAMVTKMNELTSANEVATYAESLRVRFGDGIVETTNDAFYGNRSYQNRSKDENSGWKTVPHRSGGNYSGKENRNKHSDDDETVTIKKSKLSEYIKKASNVKPYHGGGAKSKSNSKSTNDKRKQQPPRKPNKSNAKTFVQQPETTFESILDDIMNDQDFQQ